MFWLLGFLMLLLLIIIWLLVSALELNIDTRTLHAELRWKTIGRVRVWHEQQWHIGFRIFFFAKTVPLTDLMRTKGQPKKIRLENQASKPFRLQNIAGRMIDALKSFDVNECTLAIDTGNHARNAYLFPLNYTPFAKGHLYVNFFGENYFVVSIRNRPWKILYSFFRRSFVKHKF
jgi:hypothetical protein